MSLPEQNTDEHKFGRRDTIEIELSALCVRYGIELSDEDWEMVCNIFAGRCQNVKRRHYVTRNKAIFGGGKRDERSMAEESNEQRDSEPD